MKVRTFCRYADCAGAEIAWQQGLKSASAPLIAPNIVLIVADDLGYNDISTFGGGVAGAPPDTAHRSLAAQGAVFTQSYSGSSTCAPSRAMLMTGRYPARTVWFYTDATVYGAGDYHGGIRDESHFARPDL